MRKLRVAIELLVLGCGFFCVNNFGFSRPVVKIHFWGTLYLLAFSQVDIQIPLLVHSPDVYSCIPAL